MFSSSTLTLLQGIERGVCVPYSDQEFMIVSGRNRNGDTRQSIRYNVKESSYIFGPDVIHPRVLAKVFRNDEYMFVMGGAEEDKAQVEVYHEEKFHEYETNWEAMFGKDKLINYGYA